MFYSYTHEAYIPCKGENEEARKTLQLWEFDRKEEFMEKVWSEKEK